MDEKKKESIFSIDDNISLKDIMASQSASRNLASRERFSTNFI